MLNEQNKTAIYDYNFKELYDLQWLFKDYKTNVKFVMRKKKS